MAEPAQHRESRRSRITDATFALAMIAVSLLVLWEAGKQPRSPYDPIGAAGVPKWTAWAMITLALLLLARIALGFATAGAAQALFTGGDSAGSHRDRPWLTAGTLVLSLAYAAAIPAFGFLLATVAFLLALGWLLCDRAPRTLAAVAAVALIGGFSLDWTFRKLLVPLP